MHFSLYLAVLLIKYVLYFAFNNYNPLTTLTTQEKKTRLYNMET